MPDDDLREGLLDEIKRSFDADAKITVFVRHGDSGDQRDTLYGDDTRVAELLSKAFGLKKAK